MFIETMNIKDILSINWFNQAINNWLELLYHVNEECHQTKINIFSSNLILLGEP